MGSEEADSTLPPIAKALLRQLYGIQFESNKPKPKNFRKTRREFASLLINNIHFSKNQKRLLRAIADKQYLDTPDVKKIAGSKVPKAFVRDLNKRFLVYPHAGKIVAIKFSRKKVSRGYFFKFFSPSNSQETSK